MTTPKYASSAEAKKAGYYSRRNQTRAAQDEARRTWETKSSKTRARTARRGV